MKTPEKIKNALEYVSIKDISEKLALLKKTGYSTYEYVEDIAADALVYINYLEEHADAFYDLVPHWISVNDRLPEDDGHYLVWNNDRMEVAHYWGNGEWANHDYGVMVYGVTHWMTLPEQPTKDWI